MRRAACLAVVCLLGATACAQETYTYVDLAKRLTDLERLAVLPAPGDTCAQWSSYDRASRFDAATGKYVAWDANGDGGGVIRQEGDAIVMAEMEGPGCIWRIWSADAKDGHVRIYLDGAAQPAVDLPFSGYFDGKEAPFVGAALVHTAASGRNNYVPIPYRKSCRIVADKGWGNYYHFNYETFPKGTVVPTFKRDLAPEETAALAAADHYLADGLGRDPAGPRAGREEASGTATLPPGGTVVLADLKGPRAITEVRGKWAAPAPDDQALALRELVLRATWDDDKAPAVWTPLGDFFGTAPGANPCKSLPCGMTEEGGYALWYMPFAKRALIEVVNDGKTPRTVEYRIVHAPLDRPIDQLGRFHAKWHRDALLPEEPERRIDWTMVKTQGRGRFCGVMLHIWNPKGGWWGEGDEKFFVDGEKFPSTIGTGSEDYFGYAWGNAALFQNAYHNQTISNGNKGDVSVNRWHITDDVPFQKSFEGCIEKYFPNKRPTLYACVAHWYLDAAGTDPYGPVPVGERVGYNVPLPPPPALRGAIEGERLEILKKTGGNAREQELSGHGGEWSGDAHLWWTDAKPGDRLDLALPVQEAGTYALTAQLTKARDYGIVQLYLDEKKLSEPLDLYDPEVVPTGILDLGKHDLKAGKHAFSIEITGANDKAVKAYMAGLDFVRLEAVKP